MSRQGSADRRDGLRELQRQLGSRFELVEQLGRGAMGVVYRAREQSSGREVALKVVLAAAVSDATRERMRREGELTARLTHPGIVGIHSCGELAGRPYLAYELVEGARTLGELFPTLELRQRVAFLRDAARALGSAHRQGVIHRDVKPDNLLVDGEGRLRVADFGLATARDLDRMTRSGAFVGTPHYLAPEQAQGRREAMGPPVDVWSLGVALYEALTGELPFRAPSAVELFARISRGAPLPPRELAPRVPPPLEAVCLQALRQEPVDRYPHGDALADDLECWLEGRPVQASGPGLGRRAAALARRAWWLLPLAASAGAVGFALSFSPEAGRTGRPAAQAGALGSRVAARPAPSPRASAPALAGDEAHRHLSELRTDPELARLGDAAAAGDSSAMIELAYLLRRGDATRGLAADRAKARYWYRRAAAAGDLNALQGLGEMLRADGDLEGFHALMRRLVEEAADGPLRGQAMVELARYHLERNELREALRLFRDAREGGAAWLDRDLFKALGDGEDPEQLEAWVDEVFRPSDTFYGAALEWVAKHYQKYKRHGQRSLRDRWRAILCFRRGAEAGDARCMFGAGTLLDSHQFRDLDEARMWYERAAQAGDLEARAWLGLLLVDRDEQAALAELRAAHPKVPEAARWLGRLYLGGRAGLTCDPAKAAILFREGAIEGDAWAMMGLVRVLLAGRAQPLTPDEVDRWLREAVRHDVGFAREVLVRQEPGEATRELIARLRADAEAGEVKAMLALGGIYAANPQGITPLDPVASMRWLRAAALAGDPMAMLRLGEALHLRLGAEEDALYWLERAAACDDRRVVLTAQEELIAFYRVEREGPWVRDAAAQRAFWAEKAAALGSAPGLRELATIELLRPAPDFARAIAWLGEAVRLDDNEARRLLAELHLHGRGIPADEAAAVRILEAAVRGRYRPAAEHLARIRLRRGDAVEARRLLTDAAKGGYAPAMLVLGRLLRDGPGERDPEAGSRWVLEAAEEGIPEAWLELAESFRAGRGTGRDPAWAAESLYRAAQLFDPEGMYRYGRLLAAGSPRGSKREGLDWIGLAADQGHALAQAYRAGTRHGE